MRIKRGIIPKRKHRKLLQSVKGYRMTKHRLVKVAKEAQLHAGSYAYSGRHHRKSDFRRLWITRISHAVRNYGMSYSQFIAKLKEVNIVLDRKIISTLIRDDLQVFEKIVDKVKNL